MAAAAEARQIVFEPEPQLEEYGRSVRTYRLLGELVLRNEDSVELASVEELGYADFFTGVAEHIKTDEELRELFDVDGYYYSDIIAGKACDVTGVPMIENIEEGERTAAAAVEKDPRMVTEKIRTGGDARLMMRVDEMPVGTTLVALSMEPKKELQQYRKYWEKKGYRKGIAYLQWHSKDTEVLLASGSHSIDLSDEEAWRDIFAELGFAVPEGISPNEWIDNSFELQMNSVSAKQFALAIRKRYYERMNVQNTRYSINELMTLQEHILKTNFEVYYKGGLSPALFTGQNNEVMQSFAQILLKTNLDKLDPEVRQELIRVANSQKFDAAAGRLMNSLLHYAVVEQLRSQFKRLVRGEPAQPVAQQIEYAYSYYQTCVPPQVVLQALNQQHALGIETGIRAGRSYGGCMAINLVSQQNGSDDQPWNRNPQDVFGGRTEKLEEASDEKGVMKCVNCPKCRTFHEELREKNGVFQCKNIKCNYRVKA